MFLIMHNFGHSIRHKIHWCLRAAQANKTVPLPWQHRGPSLVSSSFQFRLGLYGNDHKKARPNLRARV
jgi:hypothetical protein